MKQLTCTGLQVYKSENDLLTEKIERSTWLMRVAAVAAFVLASGSVIFYLVTSAA